MNATLDGYSWLPRMLDKARAARAGTLGSYYRYPCPIDRHCLELLGIDADTFADVAEHEASDTAVIAELRARGARPPEQAAFDPVELNRELHDTGS